MTQTTTHVNACDASIWLDNAGGVLTDISGSSNSINLYFSRDVRDFRIADSGSYPFRSGQWKDCDIDLRAIYTLTDTEAVALLNAWYHAAGVMSPRTMTIYIPNDVEFPHDRYSGEVILESLQIPTDSEEPAPILVSAHLKSHLAYQYTYALLDTFERSDNGLGTPWSGATWSILSNEATNSPTEGAELLTDPGLEANYTAGLCDTLSKSGAPNLAQSGDPHGGSKAQQFQATAFNDNVYWPFVSGTANQWYQASIWAKRTAGASGTCRFAVYQANMKPTAEMQRDIDESSYTQMTTVVRSAAAGGNIFTTSQKEQDAASFDTTIADDGSLKALTFSTMLATLPSNHQDIIVRAMVDVTNGIAGVFARLDSAVSPSSFLLAYAYHQTYGIYVCLEKCVSGTYTTLISGTYQHNDTSYTGNPLRIECSGTTVKLYYDDAQVGGNQTVDDAEIVSNQIHGMICAGGATIDTFYCGDALDDFPVGFGGSSITVAAGYRVYASKYLEAQKLNCSLSTVTSATSGWSTWPNLINMQTALLDYDPLMVIFDTANDDSSDMDAATMEAYIHRIWAANPDTQIVGMVFFGVADPAVNENVNNPTNLIALTHFRAVLNHYDIPVVDFWEEVKDLVNNQGHDLDEYLADTIHPTTLGHQVAYGLLLDYLPDGGQTMPASMPVYLYDTNGEYESTPINKYGTDYDSRTGVWNDTGTRTESSQVGATITYSGTCKSIGCYRADAGNNDVEINVDGSGYQAMAFYPNGVEISSTRSPHTIVIKVMSGTVRIDEFWAI